MWNIALGFHVSTLAANSAFVFPPFQVTVEVGPCAVARVLGSDSPIRVKRVVDTRRGMAQTAVVRDFSQVRPQFLKFQRGSEHFPCPKGTGCEMSRVYPRCLTFTTYARIRFIKSILS